MTPIRVLHAGTAALALVVALPAAAQFVQQPTPTADALAVQMRQLAANPRDVFALIAAGELSTKLGDPTAALGFFGRAQAIDPRNPRVAAGKAGALILLERPGEALQLYDQAERAGLVMTPYLNQRGLAYDLTGQPGYAQRDYRRALLTDRDDETVRRLALSLGISGRRDDAMTLLDPLLRRSDRAAWRARACILALSGDVPGAQRIATTMMVGGAALSPFFGRLQWLSPVDRAFAVHFGQLSSNATRAADARLAPVVAALPVEPQALPSPAPVVVTDRPAREPNRRDTRRRGGRTEVASVAVPIATPAPAPASVLPDPPGQATLLAMRDAVPTAGLSGVPLATRPVTPTPNVVTALPAVDPTATVTPTPLSAQVVAARAPTVATPVPVATVPVLSASPAIEITTLPPRPRPQRVVAAPPPPPPPPTPVPTAGVPMVTPTPTPTPTAEAAVPVATPPVVVAPAAAAPAPTPVQAQAPIPERRTPEVARRNTTMLASIIDTIAVPASELDVAAPAPRRVASVKPVAPPAETKKADARKADAKAADAKKPDARKPEPKKPDPARTDPPRWWVQVAGGARAADLDKDWKRLSTKSPAAFRGKAPSTTPLRATNRLLAGPFKSQAEAAAFVNQLAKDGTSSFAWQSDAGQKVERLK